MYNIYNINLPTITKQWAYDNPDLLIRILHDRVLEKLEPTWLISEENESDGSHESVYNDLVIRNCARIVGDIFGFDIGIYESDRNLTMIGYSTFFKHFNFSHDFFWIKLGCDPEEKIGQDPRILKLARQKRAEFIIQYNLRERVESWLEDVFKNGDDAEIISMCFMEMNEIMDYLLDVVYCRALKKSIHMP